MELKDFMLLLDTCPEVNQRLVNEQNINEVLNFLEDKTLNSIVI
jgi:hypothetical protein